MTRHPIQPLEKDEHGVVRFKKNAIVCYLLDHGGIDMNKLALMNFPPEDREQFAQLIGYSHSGFADLPYVSDETYDAASRVYRSGETEEQARLRITESALAKLRQDLRGPIAALYGLHPDDLGRAGQ